jgi:hypothetical protein
MKVHMSSCANEPDPMHRRRLTELGRRTGAHTLADGRRWFSCMPIPPATEGLTAFVSSFTHRAVVDPLPCTGQRQLPRPAVRGAAATK